MSQIEQRASSSEVEINYQELAKSIHGGEVWILPTREDVARTATAIFELEKSLHPDGLVVTEATGCTQTHRHSLMENLSHVTFFNLDEYVGLESSHPQSYKSVMERELFSNGRTPHKHIIPNGMASDPTYEAQQYEKVIRETPVHLAFLGIGPNTTCHIGFNGPGTPFSSETHVVALDEDTKEANASFFDGKPELVPTHAITQGIQTICGRLESDGVVRGGAEKIVLLITGVHKKDGAKLTLEAPIMTKYPSTALRRRGVWDRTIVLLDRDAAGALSEKTLSQLHVHIVSPPREKHDQYEMHNQLLFDSSSCIS